MWLTRPTPSAAAVITDRPVLRASRTAYDSPTGILALLLRTLERPSAEDYRGEVVDLLGLLTRKIEAGAKLPRVDR